MSPEASACLVAPGAVMVVERAGSDPMSVALLAALSDAEPLLSVVAVLSSSGISGLPSFVCAVSGEGGTRVLARGTGVAVSGDAVVDGVGVTTWSERLLAGGEQLRLTVGATGAEVGTMVSFSVAGPRVQAVEAPPAVVSAAEVEGPTALPRMPASDDFDFNHLLHETSYHGIEAAAVRDEEELPDVAPALPPLPPPPADPSETTMFSEEAAVEANLPPLPASSFADDRWVGDDPGERPRVLVQAVHCPTGHPNAPHADTCRSCGAAVLDRSVTVVKRPSLGVLRLADGRVVELDRPVMLGRKPEADAYPVSDGPPWLITVEDPDRGLSRTHAAVVLRDWQVCVVDLHSMNATAVDLPGLGRQQLPPGEQCLILPGTSVLLGEVASFVYEVGS